MELLEKVLIKVLNEERLIITLRTDIMIWILNIWLAGLAAFSTRGFLFKSKGACFRLMVGLDKGSFPNLIIPQFHPKFMEIFAQD